MAHSDVCLTDNQKEVVGPIPTWSGNILSLKLIMKCFLWSVFPFSWFKKDSYQFVVKDCHKYQFC